MAIGLAAGALATLVLVALRFATSTPVVPEVMADWLTRVTPPAVFDFVLTRLQVAAKPLMFASLLAGQVVGGGALGVLYARYSARLPLRESQTWLRGSYLALAAWLATMLVLTPIIGGGVFGLSLPDGPVGYMATTAGAALTFGLALANLHLMALPSAEAPANQSRRQLLRNAAFVGLALAVGGLAVRAIARGASSLTPSRLFSTRGALPLEVTPNDQFYEVSKNIVNPVVDARTWKLELAGDFRNPLSLTYDDLLALPWKEQYVTLTCISNLVGGDLISNALWRGVPLKSLLERAGLAPGVERLAFHAADGYVDSFPAEYALRETTLVAYQMNGDPLPSDHGFPARIIVPGLYGMENVKWLTKIETVPASFRGYWQVRGWADTAVIKTMSRVDVPAYGDTIPLAEALVGGIAFGGDRGVSAVEVSADGGATWQPAEVREALSSYTWVLWTQQWTPASPKPYDILVRATDGAGQVQTATVSGNLPSGATGYHRIRVTAKEPEVGADGNAG